MADSAMFDPNYWKLVPFHFWSLVFFVFGSIVGSFLNVCIHRMPLGQSIVSPPSHCPHCKYSIPWYLNMPLITWLALKGRCKNCQAPISPRYFIVELLTGIMFLACWLNFGHRSPLITLTYCAVITGFIVATFIDFEHFIIPDEITIGGAVVGFIVSLLLPSLHNEQTLMGGLTASLLGIGIGGGLVYVILRVGKILFGRQTIALGGDTRIYFSETAIHWANQEIAYEEILYRKSDTIVLQARTLELVDRCYKDVPVRLQRHCLQIGDEKLDPETVHCMEATGTEIILPREAMGLGDVKFMAAIGAFLGWQATIFALMVSSVIGAAVGVTLILIRRREWSSRLPYGPYIALAAIVWIFLPLRLQSEWIYNLRMMANAFMGRPF